MYRIKLAIEGHAREFFPAGKDAFDLTLPGPVSIREIIAGLSVSADLIMSVFVNGQLVDKDSVPPDGAEVILLSPPAGG